MPAELATEYLVRTSEQEWILFAEGIEYKILRTSSETGDWTVLFRCAEGSAFPPHVHYGAGEYFLLKGVMDYRMGIARAGDYGYEPLGVFHERTQFLEDSELIFTNHGPVIFVDDKGDPLMIIDWKYFADQLEPAPALT
jgi:anti-sigma factor ChrR (cupin superfamily)